MRIVTFLLGIFLSLSLVGQDIVYDRIVGNQSYWFKIRGGPTEKYLETQYENNAALMQSKVLSAAGVLDILEKGIDYIDRAFIYDTMTYEFSTDVPINLIIYKYYHTDSTFYYYAGLRKATTGASMFEGQYLFISPIYGGTGRITVFSGIGSNRTQFVTLNTSTVNDSYLGDYMLSNQVTFQGIKISKVLRASKTRGVLTGISEQFKYVIKAYPNPTSDYVHIKIQGNSGVVIRLFDRSPKLRYEIESYVDETTINVSKYSSGIYFIVITDLKYENIINVIKLVKK